MKTVTQSASCKVEYNLGSKLILFRFTIISKKCNTLDSVHLINHSQNDTDMLQNNTEGKVSWKDSKVLSVEILLLQHEICFTIEPFCLPESASLPANPALQLFNTKLHCFWKPRCSGTLWACCIIRYNRRTPILNVSAPEKGISWNTRYELLKEAKRHWEESHQ